MTSTTQHHPHLLTGIYEWLTKRNNQVAPKIKRLSGGAGLGFGMVLIPQIMSPQGQTQASAAPLISCPKCHTYVPATSKFCPECGTPLTPPVGATIICPKCQHWIPSTSKFCPQCGTQLTKTTP